MSPAMQAAYMLLLTSLVITLAHGSPLGLSSTTTNIPANTARHFDHSVHVPDSQAHATSRKTLQADGNPFQRPTFTHFEVIKPQPTTANPHIGMRHTLTMEPVEPEVSASRNPGCKKLIWFTAVAARRDGEIPEKYASFLVPALLSALRKAPSLEPHLIYHGPGSPPIIEWWKAMGGVVHYHNLTFYDSIAAVSKAPYHPPGYIELSGRYLRFDIPLLMQQMTIPEDVDSTYTLYTDADTMFLKDIDSCTLPPTDVIRMGPEHKKGVIINAGVMYINVDGLRSHSQGIVEFGQQQHWPAVQPILLGYFANSTEPRGHRKGKQGSQGEDGGSQGRADQGAGTSTPVDSGSESEGGGIKEAGGRKFGLQLLEDRFNWKGYWGGNDDAVIIHFHGPKPGVCLECYVMHPRNVDYCVKKYHHCQVYAPFWNWLTPDGGEFFIQIMKEFYFYMGLATAEMI